MIVSFDLDGVLFLTRFDEDYLLEPELKFPWNKIYKKDRVRKGTPELIRRLQDEGFDVWVYTSSARTERYIRRLLGHYGVKLDDVVNAQRHEAEVQRGRKDRYPNKLPSRYRISLHVDDEVSVYENGRTYGFNVFLLKHDDQNWIEEIVERAKQIRQREENQHAD